MCIASACAGGLIDLPPAEREFRGVWIATVDNIDYPSKPGLPVAQMKSEMVSLLDKAADLNLNAIIFQVRPSADAFYKSPHEPWSWYLTGEQGKAPADGFDPLQFAIQEAHKRGMELHAWLNPYRALHPAQDGPLHSSHIARTQPEMAPDYGSYKWMDPGNPKVQDRGFNVFMDLVERYDLDGIHIDDYFYPYPVKDKDGKDVDFPDEASWRSRPVEDKNLTRSEWRRKNVNLFVYRIHAGIKHRKPWVEFGISPFGIYRPGVPAGIKAGIDQYESLYADAKLWLNQGWCDYYSPQLYWPIEQEPQSYTKLLDWWNQENKKGIQMWPGQFTSRTNPKDGNWPAKQIVQQILETRKRSDAPGTIHFSMKALVNNWNGVADALKSGPYKAKAIPPASRLLDKESPEAPAIRVANGSLAVEPRDEDVRFIAVYRKRAGQWALAQVSAPGSDFSAALMGAEDGAVSVIDRAGNESQRVQVPASAMGRSTRNVEP